MTVDYVVLTAGVMIIGLGVLASISDGSSGVGARIQGELDSGSSGGVETGGSGAGAGGGAFTGGGGLPPLPMPPQTPETADPAPPQDTGSGAGSGDSGGIGGPGDSGGGGGAPGNSGGNGNPGNSGGNGNPGNSGGNGGAGNGSGGSQDDTPPAEVDFTFEDLGIGCYWSDRAISTWLTLNLPQPAAFSLSGPGNPTAQTVSGGRADTGMVQWGTNIEIDIPPPGGAQTVHMTLGDQLGSFTISRDDCP